MKPLKTLDVAVTSDELVEETSNQNAVGRPGNNIQVVQNVLLIWLDTNIDENNNQYRQSISQLRQVINIFKDENECLSFLDRMDNSKVCLIISDSLGQDMVPRIHNMAQVDSIFIVCDDKTYDDEWIKEWTKIKGIFTEINYLCDALKPVVQQCEQNTAPISFMDTSTDISKKKLNQLDPSFMYTQILKEILLSMTFEEKHIIEFVEYCSDLFEDNDTEFRNVRKLERQYHEKTPIWWYTYECFLYPMVNRALRVMDADLIIKLGFFIGDLHRHIDELHKEQFDDSNSSEILTVYRGQGMTKDAFEKMNATKGGLLAFNCFLSTSRNRNVSMRFANGALANPDLIGILFVIIIDPHESTTPFASINKVSYFRGEDEILFSMHTIFRIDEIKTIDENPRLYQVNLILTSDNDKDLGVLSHHIRQESKGLTGWHQLGELLLKIGQPVKAEQFYESLLNQTTNEIEKALVYKQLGQAKRNQGKYNEAIIELEKAATIQKEILSPDHPNLAVTYTSIGNVYAELFEYSKALPYYEKTLEIDEKTLPSNHPELAKSYSNIANIYFDMGDYPKALSYHEKGLEIKKQSLPPNHPNLGMSYNDIGAVYDYAGEYSKGLSYYEKALEIQQQSLPSNHPDLGRTYMNIGNVYYCMGEYSKALPSLEKALEIRQESLPPNHPDVASSYMNIGNVYSGMDEYSKALSFLEKGLEMQQQSLPSIHPELGASHFNIGSVYENMGDYSKARSSYEHAIEIGEQSLPANHPELERWKKILDELKNKL